ncbi:putative membrane protein [Nocardioides aromaticivorans]|uniref:Putative membrane protein n=1 Tax=Nocardioides aromaticivorans TaxID=200618 RepID=A0A7Y9ZLP2_9ACTN|nr:hypothetical protein [Nocardioides aromaticivorans]NYI46643.1 putative membrane protein [Nocardioides aromaticivorans]
MSLAQPPGRRAAGRRPVDAEASGLHLFLGILLMLGLLVALTL